MKKPTITDNLRAWEKEQRETVQALLGWSDERYTEFQYYMAIEWIIQEFGADCPLINRVLEERMFWSWWRLHWVKRDQEFVEMFDMLRPDEYDTYYEMQHEPASVYFKPHSVIMHATYEKLITKIVNNHTQK